MAGPTRPAAGTVTRKRTLQDEPYRFDFFQALRLLECLHPDRPRIGTSRHAAEDPVRLAQEPSLAFAPSTVASFEPGKDGRPPTLAVYGPGMLGPNGPLPVHLTEYIRDRRRNAADPTFARFLDLFHHRMLSLFYRAWASAQPAVNLDRPADDRFAVFIGSLFGLGIPSLRGRDALPDAAKLHFAGQMSCQTRHPDGLQAMLKRYFKIPVKIREFVGQWLEVPFDARWRLGESPDTGRLGRVIVLGASIWERQRKFRVVLGPLSLSEYRRMLPEKESMRRLIAMVRNYIGDELMWDVQLVLGKEHVPSMVLGGRGHLGRTTWLAGRPFEGDAEDLLVDPLAREFANDRD